jgi:HEAT repeat protein
VSGTRQGADAADGPLKAEIRDQIRQNIPHIIEILKDNDQNTQSAAAAALSQLAEYRE